MTGVIKRLANKLMGDEGHRVSALYDAHDRPRFISGTDKMREAQDYQFEDKCLGLPSTPLRVPMPPVTPPTSIVGGLVAKLHKSLKTAHASRTELEARIAADTESLRQTNASIQAVEGALDRLANDPALTDAERDMVGPQVQLELDT